MNSLLQQLLQFFVGNISPTNNNRDLLALKPTGLRTLRPHLQFTAKDMWEVHLLEEAASNNRKSGV